MTSLSQKIITTLAYYDVLDYPMTPFEIWKYLTIVNNDQALKTDKEEIDLAGVIKELESKEIKRYVSEFQGYYFLKGRQGVVRQRLERNKIAEQKFKTTRRIVKWLRLVPFVRMVAVTGTLAMKNTKRKSDLDLLIVLEHGHIFTGRTLVTGLVHLLGARRYKNKIADRICLNFFITDKSLEINLQDLFSAHEYSFIFPLFGRKYFHKFQEANRWIKSYKENFAPDMMVNMKMLEDGFGFRMVRNIGEIILSDRFFEHQLKKWQTERIKKDPRTHLPGSMVMADDNALIFLPEPEGPRVFEEFQARLKKLKVA